MTSAPPPRLAAAVLALALAAACGREGGGDADDGPPPRPDVIVWLTDTVRQDHLSVYGYERPTSPALEELARDGVLFREAYAPSSWTKASTASLLTGLDPVLHRTRGRDSRVPASVTLLAERMRELGYYTAGVVTNVFVSTTFGFERGFDRFDELGMVEARHVGKRLQEVLGERPEDRPLFLYVHTIDPHGPYDPPEPWATTFNEAPDRPAHPEELRPGDSQETVQNMRDLYDAEILFHDTCFGNFREALMRRGMYEDCLLWFVSDHGDEFLEHARHTHGRQLYNEVVRVPILAKLPGLAHAGTVVDEPASLIDVVPTLLSMLRVPRPPALSGMDLSALIAGEPGPLRPLFFDLDLVADGSAEEQFVAQAVLLGRHKLIEEVYPVPGRFLFDVVADPGETENLIDERTDVALELASLLEVQRARLSDGLILRFAGDPALPAQTVEAVLRTDGRFTGVDALEAEPGDRAELDATGRELRVTFVLERYASNVGGRDAQDLDSLALHLDPPDAAVTLESLRSPGAAEQPPVFLGLERTRVDAPIALAASDPRIVAQDPEALFRDERREKVDVPGGLYVIARRPLGSEDVDALPAHVRDQLEKLGYLGN